MNLSSGCMYCRNLVRSAGYEFHCSSQPNKIIKNAGACFVEVTMNDAGDEEYVIIESCPFFLHG